MRSYVSFPIFSLCKAWIHNTWSRIRNRVTRLSSDRVVPLLVERFSCDSVLVRLCRITSCAGLVASAGSDMPVLAVKAMRLGHAARQLRSQMVRDSSALGCGISVGCVSRDGHGGCVGRVDIRNHSK